VILPYKGIMPKVDPHAFIERTALVIGDVEIGARTSVWFYGIVRGDENYIRIGERTNIQDSAVVHVTHETAPAFIGSETTVGHRAVIHGCRVGDHSLIGMGAVILDGASVGNNCIIGAGSVVPPGMGVPDGKLAMGVPAKIIRELTNDDEKLINDSLEQYLKLPEEYAARNCVK